MTRIIFGLIILAFAIWGAVDIGERIKRNYGHGVWAVYFLGFACLFAFFNSGWGG